jgi:hypothetical protein
VGGQDLLEPPSIPEFQDMAFIRVVCVLGRVRDDFRNIRRHAVGAAQDVDSVKMKILLHGPPLSEDAQVLSSELDESGSKEYSVLLISSGG